MIRLIRRSLWDSIKYRLWRPYRERKDAEMREAIRKLVSDPSLACSVEGEYIPNGYGHWNITPPWERM